MQGIYIVKSFYKKKLNRIIEEGNIPNDLSLVCDVELAKSDVIFLKLGHNKYIDIEYVKNIDKDTLEEYLSKRIYDNVILRQGNYVPKVGQLFIRNLIKYKPKKIIKKL